MAKKKQPPTVEIYLTVDGAILHRQPRGVRVVFKDFATDPDSCKDDPDAVNIQRTHEGHPYIFTEFPAH